MKSLRYCQKTLDESRSFSQKNGKKLTTEELSFFNDLIKQLEVALTFQNKEKSSLATEGLQKIMTRYTKKTGFSQLIEFLVAFTIALGLAIVARQMVFELYQIPTGSMRPTLREKDRLLVSKTDFGINIPLKLGHFYFDDKLVHRLDLITFTAEGIPIRDPNTRYFYLFPGKKNLIKRCIAKGGDRLYFYGGKIYALDKEGNDLPELRNSPVLKHLEHIPFITFEGTQSRIGQNTPTIKEYVFYQMNLPIARVIFSKSGNTKSQLSLKGKWVPEKLSSQPTKKEIAIYNDFWGLSNYGMARLLTKEQAQAAYEPSLENLEEGLLYLEITHHPMLANAYTSSEGKLSPITILGSILPLQKEHLKRIMDNMYTSRFVIKDGYACRYDYENKLLNSKDNFKPRFPYPNGTYEFYCGKAFKVGIQGGLSAVEKEAPLYSDSLENIQNLFNLGIEWHSIVDPNKGGNRSPSRYVYFRNGDLYLLGAPILLKGDKILTSFENLERQKAQELINYTPFVDNGPPLNEDGSLNKAIIENFGLQIPAKTYLVLGDNHSSSSDSREFGFLPEANIRGRASWIIWPFGPRWGWITGHQYNLALPKLIVWGSIFSLIGLYFLFTHRKRK